MAQRKRLAIIDGKSVFYRGYYAMPNLSTKDGTPTGGVYGFAMMALEVIKRLDPDYVCVAWDKAKTNIRKRKKLYPKYKAGRKPPPPDFYEQIPVLQELLEAFGWPLYELDDYEADDIMGTLADQATKQGIDTALITSDLDLLQVVNDNVHVYAIKNGLSNIHLYKPESFTEKYNIEVKQFLDLKALMGDSSDNIPGVPGVGIKTATKLIQDHKTLDGVYDNLDLIKDTVRTKLVAGKDSAYLSKKIAAIWLDAPITLNLNEVDGSNCDPNELMALLKKLEFRSLVRQLPDIMQLDEDDKEHSVFEQGFRGTYEVIDSDEKLKKLKLTKADRLVIYGRAASGYGKNPINIFISTDQKNIYSLVLQKLNHGLVKRVLNGVKHIPVVGYDVKNTLKMYVELDVDLPPVEHDVAVGAFLLDSLRRERSLTDLATADLGYEGSSLDELDLNSLLIRAPEIISIIWQLYDVQSAGLEDVPSVQKMARDIEWPVIPVLARMEHRGIQLDVQYMVLFNKQLTDAISDLEQQIYGYADQEFNIASPTQLADILFNKLHLPTQGIKKGKTGYSTAASELEKLRDEHEIVGFIGHYREVTKLQNTYVGTLPKMVDGNSRLHTTFNLAVAQTGRLSSSDPNLQNIPVRTELGKRIRTAFVTAPGKVLISADYSQFELRLAAVLADDKKLIELFNNGADIHRTTAAEVYKRNPEDVSKKMRSDAKVINFGVLYGMSPHGLSAATGMTFEQSKSFIDKYFELRKPLLRYLEGLKEKARTDGYVETMFGRRRPTPDVNSANYMVRQGAERVAINMPIQGTEADLMKMAMVEIDKKLQGKDAHMLLQIHDSVVVECDELLENDVSEILKTTMEGIYKLPVNLDVDVSVGNNWGAL